MKLKIDIAKIKTWVVHAPLHFLVPSVVLVLVLILAGARLIWFNRSAPVVPMVAQQASPAPAVNAPTAKPAATQASAPAAPTPATSAATQASALMVEPPAPGVPEPAGLVPMKLLYKLESSPEPAINAQPSWSELGHKLVEARAVSFQTMNVKSLDDLLPSSGLVRETWSFWTQSSAAGDWVVALKAGGYFQSVVTVQVDGRDVPALGAHPGNDVSNSVATLRLGSGWHQVTISFTQQVSQDPKLMHGTVDLFWRGPTDAQPVVIVPSAVDSTKVQPAVQKTTSDARSAAPSGASSAAHGSPAHTAPASSTAGVVK